MFQPVRTFSGAELRERFLAYFERHGHQRVPSSSLVPSDDPTLLFTNAGMNQFKEVFLGLASRPYDKAVTSQKCVRAGGKHNDLDAVGRTARHHTFFEMLGNFSFGDYFKSKAIRLAWDFLTGELGLPPARLYATIYRDDDEAARIWEHEIGLPAERIIRLGEKDNFWQMGDTGPCGPCSEILIDLGEDMRCQAPVCAIGQCDCDRWREIWNLVFMQFDRDASGKLTPLPKTGVDTGMGLERLSALMQGVWSNYDTDLLRPLVTRVEAMSGRTYDSGPAGMAFRVIADHARACTFLIADGVRPANDGRGYVLRRILRRAVRYGRTLGLDKPFLHALVDDVVSLMKAGYPELVERRASVAEVIRREEARFGETLEAGMRRVEELLEDLRREGRTTLSGPEIFQLYDTYGFPVDLTEDIALEVGVQVDRAGFEAAMTEQRRRARESRKAAGFGDLARVATHLRGVPPTRFIGYERVEGLGRVLAVLVEDEPAGAASVGEEAVLVLDETPFYPEGGGQIGDQGQIVSPEGVFEVSDTRKLPDGQILHVGRVTRGQLAEGQEVRTEVGQARRQATRRNHTATHLLHAALRQVIGRHVQQAGSYVGPDRLRFDYATEGTPAPDQLSEVERWVNQRILEDLPVETDVMELEAARATGAMALFGEKYGQTVRVVRVGDGSLSRELCGGTHVSRTGEIGLARVVSETSVGAGVRRVEMLTGEGLLQHLRERDAALQRASEELRTTPAELAKRVQELVQRLRAQERDLARLEVELLRHKAANLLDNRLELDGVACVVGQLPTSDADRLREAGDYLRDRLGGGLVVLGAESGGRALVVVMAGQAARERGIHAGQLARRVAERVGGSGGGRPDLAQAGARDLAKLSEALASVPGLVAEMLSASGR